MSKKFQNKYRIESNRLKNWDYAQDATYFITICTKNMTHYFGKIINGEMNLSELGKITHSEWLKTIELRPDMNITFGEFIIMPNHFHAIISIGENQYNSIHARDALQDNEKNISPISTDALQCVSCDNGKNIFVPQRKNLASITRGFKGAITRNARRRDITFNWQPNYHDRIIWNQKAFYNISKYIINNPKKWSDDEHHN
jgi:REP element-mobilizing transposase RayT